MIKYLITLKALYAYSVATGPILTGPGTLLQYEDENCRNYLVGTFLGQKSNGQTRWSFG